MTPDSYEFLKAHFDRIQAGHLAARVELLDAAKGAVAFLKCVEWNDRTSETEAANIRHRLEEAIASLEPKPADGS